ncbi:T9SS type A sorting domain-containing protein [Maribellus sp. CM-23]|uniref:immunoglobulin domain-containing protein n=1 Tax=Maribellus sp. CM-23 TaxID=2781026 RepID=UPI001F180112|nr:immunoglobulin domain-containing protein [Maribellus sp. CM-23]MCE4565062.1 T9SS type A sorting domain-containing protein [Maribellus sp. CM-23]
MKTITYLGAVIVIFLCFQLSLSAQNTYVPDDNFEQALIDLGYDSGALNDSVATNHISLVTELNLSGKDISSLEGITAFENLQSLNISNNRLSSIDLSFNAGLVELICYNNVLTELNLGANKQLEKLNCSNNQLEILNLSSISALKYINCSTNNLNTLNIRNGNNPIMAGADYRVTGIDTRNNTTLYCIEVDNPELSASYTTWTKDKWTSYETNCSDYKVDMTYVPDDNFEQHLIDLGYDSGLLNDSIPTSPIKSIEYLNISHKQITDLTGIESFESLTSLYCSRNEITHLDLSENKKLTSLDCSFNKITSLDISKNSLLTTLYSNSNQLVDIDISQNPFLRNINCSDNLLTGLNLRNGNNNNLQLDARYNPNLLCIQVDDVIAANNKSYWYKNAYTAYSEDCSSYTIEMTYVPDDNFEQALINMGCDTGERNDSVPTIAISKLKSLSIDYKNITDLTGIEDFTALEQLHCYNNQISTIDLTSNSNLKTLQIQNNLLIDLNLSKNPYLTNIYANNNQLTSLNLQNGNNSNMSIEVRNNPDLLCIQVDDSVAAYRYSNWHKNAYAAFSEDCSGYVPEMTYIPDDNFEQALINLGLDFDKNLNDSVPTVALHSLTSLYLSSKSIYDLTGIQSIINLKYLYCSYNYLDSLDLSRNTELMELNCDYNNLNKLDISANNKLTKLACNNNSLTSIVFSIHDLLEYINCSNNEIKEILDIESALLTYFYCDNNKLTKLDLYKLPALTLLTCRDNNLNELDVSSNSQLRSLVAERNLLTFINLQNGNNENLQINLYQNMPACIQVDDTIVAKNKLENVWGIDDWSYYSENCSAHRVDMVYIPDDNFERDLIEQRYDDGILNDSVPKAIVENIDHLNIDNSNITDLAGIETFINLKTINCNNNNITKLDLSKNIHLQGIYCANNKIDTLNISSCYGLKELTISYNLISEIDVNSFPELYRFWCNNNNIVSLNLSNNPKLDYFIAIDNNLSSLNLTNRSNQNLQFNVTNNPNLFCIEVDDAYSAIQNARWYKDETAYYSENCSNKSVMTYIPDDNFEQVLIDLGYDSGELNDSVPTSKIYSITYLNLSNKEIRSLEGIQDFEQLRDLNCSNNLIEELDLSKNKKLTYLRCQRNNLYRLNYKNGNNSNSIFVATTNPYLYCIEVDNAEASSSYSNWQKDEWADYSEDCSDLFDKKTYIPDDNFEQALIDLGYDYGELDDSVSTSIIAKLIGLSIHNKNISNLEGIEDFIALEELYCQSNNIKELNLTNNSKLLYVDCSRNQLASLNVTNNKSLMRLTCNENALTELDLTQNLELEHLICYYNNIVTLNLESNSKLLMLQCFNNNLSELNIKNGNNLEMSNYSNSSMMAYENPNLKCIQVDDAITANSFKSWYKGEGTIYSENCQAILSKMTYVPDDNFEQALIDLGYDFGELDDSVATTNIITITSLDISGKQIADLEGIQDFSSLEELFCYSNLLTNLDINSNTSLKLLSCYSNMLEYLNVDTNINLVTLSCYDNQIDSIDVSKNLQLKTLAIENNSISSLDVKNNTELTYLTCSNNALSSLDVSNNKKLEILRCGHNNISFLNLNSNGQLISLDCISCKIPNLDLSNNRSLQFLNCSGNLLSMLNLSMNSSLGDLLCSNNQLQSLTIGENTSIYRIVCFNNKIEEIDVSECSNLRSFDCHENDLLKLNVRNGNNKNMTSNEESGDRMWAYGNPNLSCIEVDDPVASESYSNWQKDSWASYSKNCGFQEAGIPFSEYRTLVDLYHSTNGPTWNNSNNWLDTTNASVIDWHGITVENGHVTKIILNENNLQNSAFTKKVHLPDLRVIEMNDNRLTGFNFNAIDSLSLLDTLALTNNHLVFDDLLPAFSNVNYQNFADDFYYQQQQKVDFPQDHIVVVGAQLELSLTDSVISDNDRFQWFKEGIPLEGKVNQVLRLESVTSADSGAYHVEITNPGVPDLVLKSHFKIVNLYHGVAAGKGVPDKEYQALVDFYHSTNGSSWTNNTNWLDTVKHTVADWFGITVTNGHVSKIYFGPYENYNLNGSIPNSIKNLTQLESFEILTDKLHGELPTGLFELTNLKTLYLSECDISGTIPKEIGNLTKLEVLGLEANQLEGTIPVEIGNLTRLNFLNLLENNVNGTIPATIGKLTNLQYLGLSQNNLSGTVPASIGNLLNLKWLLLNDNRITGPLPIELANLDNVIKIYIDNNLIGSIETTQKSGNTKDALISDNRQIPDELSSWLLIDTLHLENNQLQFNDIEAILNWDNFSGINEFTYAPQNDIGEIKTLSANEGSFVKLSIDNYYPGPSDQYQWFKNGQMLTQANAQFLEIENVSYEDAGIYYCKVSNSKATDLVLSSKEITLAVTAKEPTAVLATEDLERLTEIFNTYNGEEWRNNWLDTVNYTINEWLGLQIENGHVSKIDLSNLNLEGEVLDVFLAFDSLKWLNLSNNNLYGPFPSFSGNNASNTKSVEDNNHRLSYLNISNNRFLFSDLEQVASELMSIDTFIYSPQQIFGFPIDSTINTHDSISIHFETYTAGENDVRHWYKSNTLLTDSGSEYRIDNASLSDSGTYQMQVTNSIFPDLRLESALYNLSVSPPVGIDDIELRDIQVYPNPASDKIFIETQRKTVDLSIINASGTKVFQKNAIQSDWINVDAYPKGLYLFQIKFKGQILYKKILLE